MSNKKKKQKIPHLIVLKNNRDTGEPPSAVCTCTWSFGPSELLIAIGRAAKKHAEETGHTMRRHV